MSPGPGNPNQSGNCLKIVKHFYKKTPILGVCLGHQVIGQAFNSRIVMWYFEHSSRADIIFDIVPPTKTIDFTLSPALIQYQERKLGKRGCIVRSVCNFLHQQRQVCQRGKAR